MIFITASLLTYISGRFGLYHKFCKIALVSPTYSLTFMFVGFKNESWEENYGAKHLPQCVRVYVLS